MTLFQKIMAGMLIAAVAGLGIYSFQQNQTLRLRVDGLQSQQADLIKQLRELTREKGLSPATASVAVNPRSRTNQPSGPARNIPRWMLSEPISSADIMSELERALSEKSPGRREAAMSRILHGISTNDIPRVLALVAERPGLEGARSSLFKELSVKWGETDPAAAVAWASKLSDPNAQKIATVNALKGWCNSEPEDAARYAVALPPGDLQDASVLRVVHEWSFRDAASAVNWVTQFPPGKLRDEVSEPLIFWGQGSCPAAIAEMLDSFADPELYKKHAETVASIWLNRDEAAARAWIQQAPLPDDVRQRLLAQKIDM